MLIEIALSFETRCVMLGIYAVYTKTFGRTSRGTSPRAAGLEGETLAQRVQAPKGRPRGRHSRSEFPFFTIITAHHVLLTPTIPLESVSTPRWPAIPPPPLSRYFMLKGAVGRQPLPLLPPLPIHFGLQEASPIALALPTLVLDVFALAPLTGL